MMCTCWLVCHGMYLLSCVSWCVLVGLCVMVCTCCLVCHGVYLLACESWCVLVGLCVMVCTCWLVCVRIFATEPRPKTLQEVVEACTTAIQLYHNCISVAKIVQNPVCS